MARGVFVIALVGSIAAAAPSPKATSLAKEAERLYKDGQYLDAAKLLEEALAIEANPKLLYNMARAYDQAGELSPALEAYRRYVGLPSTDSEPDLVKKANLSMDRLRQLLARQEADTRIRDAEKERLEREAKEAKARADSEAEKARTQKAAFEAKERARTEVKQSSMNGKKIAAFVVAGVGVAALANGIIFGLVSNGSKQAFRQASTSAEKRSLQDATVSQAVVADISLLIGLVCAITAFILFPFGDVAATVTPLPSGAAASFSFTF